MSSASGVIPAAVSLSRSAGFLQARGAPYLVALRECAGDRKGDLAGRAGDQDLLAVEHPPRHVIAHRHPNVKYLICWACAAAVRRRRRGVPRGVRRLPRRAPARRGRGGRGAIALDVARAGMVAALAAAAVRPRLAAAGQPAGVRRPQRQHPRSSSCTARSCRGDASTTRSTRRASASSRRRCCRSVPTSRSSDGRCRSCAPR